MVPIGGTSWMLLLAAIAGCGCLVVALAVGRRMGPVAGAAWGGLLWSIMVIGLVTLLPPVNHPGIVPASQHQTSCSWDIGGPSPGGFWIFGGGQQLLNALLFVPAGLLMTVAFSRWRVGRLLVPVGFLMLAAYSLGIEEIQLHVARIDRACDVTDIIDNVAGAGVGVIFGMVLLPVLRPWRGRGTRRAGDLGSEIR